MYEYWNKKILCNIYLDLHIHWLEFSYTRISFFHDSRQKMPLQSLFRQSNAWHLIFFFQNHVHFLYFSIPVTNLCPGLQYEVQIAAYNNHGDGPSRSIFLHTNGKVYFVQLSRLIFYHSMLKKICKPWLLLKFQFSDSMIGFGEPYMITIHQLIPYMSVLWL